MIGAQALVESLKFENQQVVFGIPGGANLPFYDELQKQDYIRHISVRHEQGAAHAAEGYARASGKVGVCIGTSGPGATNLITGITDAYMDSVPLIALMGQVPTQLLGKDAFQEADNFSMTIPITKHNFKVMKSNEIPSVMKSAYRIASTGRPGPVAVEFPKDTMTKEMDGFNQSILDYKNIQCLPLNYYQPSEPAQDKIIEAANLLLGAERPIILGGGGVTISNADKEFTALAESLVAYTVTTITAKGAISDYHPLALGQLGMHGRQVSNHAVANSDVLLAVGTRFSDRITGDIKTFAPYAKIIHIDIDPSEFNKNVKAHLTIRGDAKTVLTSLLMQIRTRQKMDKSAAWREKVNKLNKDCMCTISHETVPIVPERVMYDLNKALPQNTIVTTEVGHNQMYATHFFKSRSARNFITSAGLGTMGFGLPAAIGAKCARPNDPVIDIAGDGSLVMVCQEMATSVEEKLPVAISLLNNGWYGIVKQWQKKFYGERYIATNLGGVPDFVKLAEAFGGKGQKVSRPSELAEAIKTAITSDVLYLVDVTVSPEDTGMPLVPPLGSNTEMILAPQCPLVGRNYFGMKVKRG